MMIAVVEITYAAAKIAQVMQVNLVGSARGFGGRVEFKQISVIIKSL